MLIKKVAKGVGRITLRLLWPWPAIKGTLRLLNAQRQEHRENILTIKDLARRARRQSKVSAARNVSFDEMLKRRPPGAPSVLQLEKRFLFQKRLALATCMVFILMTGYGLAKGHWLGVATLLSCLPLFFMASLSAQLRLWQLRTGRLSKDERGGLGDFIHDFKGWYWQVLDPEFGYTPGAKP